MSNDGAGLRECPGCGDKCTRVIGGPGTRGGPMFWAGCDVCRWRTWGNTEDEAIAAWNRRALSAVAPPCMALIGEAQIRATNESLTGCSWFRSDVPPGTKIYASLERKA